MKKLVLLAASSLVASAAYAHGPEDHAGESHAAHSQKHVMIPEKDGVTVTGFMNVIGSHVSQDIDRGFRDTTLANDTEVHVNVRHTSDAGFAYGAVIELEADVSEDFNEEGLNADKTFLFVESGYGRAEAGAVTDAGSRLSANPAHFARGTGGVHGDWFAVTAFPADPAGGHSHGDSPAHLGHENFIHSPSLPLHEMHGAAEDANKISYFSPRINGVQVGVSFIPDSGDAGTYLAATGKSGHREYGNVVNAGINAEHRFGDIRIEASAVGEYGNEEVPGHEDLKAYELAAQVGYKRLTVGAAYGDWGTSVQHATSDTPDGGYYALGADYDAGIIGVSVTYLDSKYLRNDLSAVSLGVDYKAIPGLTPFVEVTQASLDANDPAIADNDATVIQTGLLFNF